uniref:T-box domain-containing protein n=1 Tax=Macrostomum lignano TaxID=282301 RepID=A0A1I8FN12_9PLAT
MFPAFKVSLTHLEPDASYSVLLEAAVQGDAARHRFVRRRLDVRAHPDSPAPGRHWMARPVSFHRLKLTNSEEQADRLGHLHLVRLDNRGAPELSAGHSFTFKETEFIAVTAYQNEKITRLKIDHNPFARGFRSDQQQHQAQVERGLTHWGRERVVILRFALSLNTTPDFSSTMRFFVSRRCRIVRVPQRAAHVTGRPEPSHSPALVRAPRLPGGWKAFSQA